MRVDIPPFNDVRVRQAMRLIVDRQQMLDLALNGQGRIGNDLYAVEDPVYASDLPQRQQDLEQAKSLLAQAGKSDLTVELPTSSDYVGFPESAQVISQQALKAGVTINVKKLDSGTYWDGYLKFPSRRTSGTRASTCRRRRPVLCPAPLQRVSLERSPVGGSHQAGLPHRGRRQAQGVVPRGAGHRVRPRRLHRLGVQQQGGCAQHPGPGRLRGQVGHPSHELALQHGVAR